MVNYPPLASLSNKTSKDLCIHNPVNQVTFSSVHHIYLHSNNAIPSILHVLFLNVSKSSILCMLISYGKVRCGVNPQSAQLLKYCRLLIKLDIVNGNMLVVYLTCYKLSVTRTMLTWGTLSTQVPYVDIMFFWMWLFKAVWNKLRKTSYFEYVYG